MTSLCVGICLYLRSNTHGRAPSTMNFSPLLMWVRHPGVNACAADLLTRPLLILGRLKVASDRT